MHGVEPTFPYVIGFDGAGTVAATGRDVTGFAEGDRVYADRHAESAECPRNAYVITEDATGVGAPGHV